MDASASNDFSSSPAVPHNAPNQSSAAASHPRAHLTADDSENATRRQSLHIDIDRDLDPSATATDPLLSPPSTPGSDDQQMGRRTPPSDDPDSANGDANGHGNGHSNGHANGHRKKNGRATGAMSGALLEQRRKHVGAGDRAPAARVVARESFSLDDEVPPLLPPSSSAGGGGASAEARGFSQLPAKDRRNFLLLVLLYFLQGLPMGLALGSLPLLLKQHVSYTQMGVFSLASYPYSLKLLWSPIVDALWSPVVGRRKSWILPVQALSGMGMIWLSGHVDGMMVKAGEDGGAGVWGFTWWWFALVFMCATQDIAVDGWALTLLSPENLPYASTAQTVGLTAGQFLTSTIFLAFNSKDFANRWFRSAPGDDGLVSLGAAVGACGWMYLLVTVLLAVGKREEKTRNEDGVWDTYKVMLRILKMRNVQTFMLVHLVAKLGFQANDGATQLKLIDKGFGQDNMALAVLIDFPFEIGLGYYIGKWSSVYRPMTLWSWAFVGRLVAALVAQAVVWVYPAGGVTVWYLGVVIVNHVFSTFMSTAMFVAIAAFHARIADPTYGGTYMTLLATLSNLGGTFPKFFVLKLIDMLTVATCVPPTTPPAGLKGAPVTSPFSCVAETEKHRCVDGGGRCNISTDGYYLVNVLCVTVGALIFWSFIGPAVKRLQALPVRAWRLGHGDGVR